MHLRLYVAVAAMLIGTACVPEQQQQAERRPVIAATPTTSLFNEPAPPTEPIGFSRVVTSIPAGTTVGRYIFGWTCSAGDFKWTGFYTDELRSPEYATRFGSALSQAGYRVIGESSRLFDIEAERAAVRYLVGAQAGGCRLSGL